MRIAIFTTSYPQFLTKLYLETPGLEGKSYSEQLAARNEGLFGFADFYSRGFRANGHEAVEFHLNNPWLQYAWAKEHGVPAEQPAAPGTGDDHKAWSLKRHLIARAKPILRPIIRTFLSPSMPSWQAKILRAQVEAYEPDVIYNQEPAAVRSEFLEGLRASHRWIIGQIASARPSGENFRAYDLVVSSLPSFVAHFRKRGLPSAYNRLAFEPSVWDRIGPPPVQDIPLSFVGSLSLVHRNRLALLEYVARRLPLKLWGNDIERLPSSSPLHRCYQGQAWGRSMFEILGRSQITLNNHEAVAGPFANNLRLYEASGMGALQLVDRKSDLHKIFVPGEEVAAFDSLEDCVAQAQQLLADDTRRKRIADAGQRRAMETHNYVRRTSELLEIFEGVRAGMARQRWLTLPVET